MLTSRSAACLVGHVPPAMSRCCFNPEYITGDSIVWEREPKERLAAEGQLGVYFHEGFWQTMDTLRDKNSLKTSWNSDKAPWKMWKLAPARQ
jgi:NDP-sugar pyrophosphorylase family protein